MNHKASVLVLLLKALFSSVSAATTPVLAGFALQDYSLLEVPPCSSSRNWALFLPRQNLLSSLQSRVIAKHSRGNPFFLERKE